MQFQLLRRALHWRFVASAAVLVVASAAVLALAHLFFLFAAGAAAVLELGVTVFSIFAGYRRRAGELAMVRAVGISDGALRISLLQEQLLVLLPAILLGAVAGWIGATLALPALPEFTSTSGHLPLQFQLSVLPDVALIVGVLLVLAAATAGAAAQVLR